MQSELNYNTLKLYKSLILLSSAGYKPKFNSLSSVTNLEPFLWYGDPIYNNYEFNFSFPLYNEDIYNPITKRLEKFPIIYFNVSVNDLDIDWNYLNHNLGYEIMNFNQWKYITGKEL